MDQSSKKTLGVHSRAADRGGGNGVHGILLKID
jgi:hypothetical protein